MKDRTVARMAEERTGNPPASGKPLAAGTAVMRLVRIGVPADRPAAAARAGMAARMAPELTVVDIDTRADWPLVAGFLRGDGLPWALLVLPGAGPAGADLARRAVTDGRPPARVLIRAEGDPGTVRAELTATAGAGAPLPCPVVILLTAVDEAGLASPGDWRGLGMEPPTVRLLAPDAPLEAIARCVKEELRVWPPDRTDHPPRRTEQPEA